MLVAVLVAVLVFFAFAASVTSSFLLVVVASLATSLLVLGTVRIFFLRHDFVWFVLACFASLAL